MRKHVLHSFILLLVFTAWALSPGRLFAQDTDGDGMPDSYENAFGCLQPNTVDSAVDFDSDGMTSLAEYTYSSLLNPCIADTDGDGVDDGAEVAQGANPLDDRITPGYLSSGDIRLTTDPAASNTYPRSLVWTGTEFGVSWSDGRSGQTEVYFMRVNASGGKVGGDVALTSSAFSGYPALAWSGSEFGVVWYDARDGNDEIYFARVSSAGTKVGSEVRLTSDAATSINAAIAFTGSEYGVAWSDNRDGNQEIYFTRVSPAGVEVGNDARLTSASNISDSPSLVWTGTEFGMSWHDYRDSNAEIYFARVSGSGSKIGNDVRLTFNSQLSWKSSLAWSGSEFGVSWMEYRDGNAEIYFTRVSAAGAEVNDDVRLTTDPSTSGYPSLAWSGSEFGVSWTDYRNGNNEIYFTRVSAAGTEIADDLRLTYDAATSSDSSLVWAGSGWGVAWKDYRDGGSGEVYLSLLGYDNDGDGLTDAQESVAGTNASNWDTDGDLIPDGYEVSYSACLLPLTGDSLQDGDTDGLANLAEYDLGSNPCDPDTDGDGMDDYWENSYAVCGINLLAADATADNDADSLDNLTEYGLGSNPCVADTDGDGMDDNWEVTYSVCGMDLLTGDSSGDFDADNLSNLDEYGLGTDPCNSDTDGDGLADDLEALASCTDPLVADTDADGLADGVEDSNANGVQDPGETDPCNDDSDGDGVSDWHELNAGSNPLDSRITTLIKRLGGENRITFMTGSSSMPSLAWTGSEYGVSWDDYRTGNDEIHMVRISQAGAKVGTDYRVSQDVYTSTASSLAWTGSEFGVCWHGSETGVIYFTRLSASGGYVGPGISFANDSYASQGPSLAWTGSEFGVGWHDTRFGGWWAILFTRISAAGAKIGGDIQETSEPSLSHFPSLVWAGSEFGVAWQDNRDGNYEIYFTRLTGDGTEVGGQVRLTSDPSTSYYPSLAWTGSEYGVSWEEYRDGNSEIYFTRVSANGNKIGNDIRLTHDPAGSTDPSLAWTGSEFAVSWVDGRDGNNEIYFTWLTATGFDLDYDLRLTYDGASSSHPSLVRAGSELGVAWDDARDGNNEIYFTRVLIGDNDGDGLGDSAEAGAGTDPLDWDTDDDLLPDGWEFTYSACISPLTVDDALDPDNDGLINSYEYELGTNPCSVDTDGDGMDDAWELNYSSCGVSPVAGDSASADPDHDSLTNLEESQLGTSPCNADTDGDGLVDSLETQYSLDPLAADSDGDGLSDSEEVLVWLTDPQSADSDGDGMNDGWESGYACLDPLTADAAADPDGDGQDNYSEYLAMTDPCAITDSDGDGMSDWWENQYTCVDSAIGDSLGDPDSDGRTNLVEYGDRTDPCISDLVAEPPRLVNYQGRLMDGSGQPVSGVVAMTFTLFDGETGGTALWSEAHAVTVGNGLYSVQLGGDTVIPGPALALPDLYLEINAGGEVLAPRQKITAAPRAINADFINGKRLETGTKPLNVPTAASTVTVHVSFDHVFSMPPRVVVTNLDRAIGAEVFISARIFNVTTSGFDVTFMSHSGNPDEGSAYFGYYAYGE